MISEQKQVGDYTFVVISDKGLSHSLSKIPNQDAVMYEVDKEDFAIAVSDGVGSCRKADVGAKCAVESVRKVFTQIMTGKIEFEPKIVIDAIVSTWKSSIDDCCIDDYCTTLKAAIKKGTELLLISIGDGMLVVTSEGLSKSAPSEEGSFINQTACLNKDTKNVDFWVSIFKLDTYVSYVVFLSTDGVANGITEGQELELVRELETNIDNTIIKEELERFVVSISDYSADDRSVGMVKYERKNAKSIR